MPFKTHKDNINFFLSGPAGAKPFLSLARSEFVARARAVTVAKGVAKDVLYFKAG